MSEITKQEPTESSVGEDVCQCVGCKKRRETAKRMFCAVCGSKPPRGWYMAKDEVWAAAGLNPNDIACLLCFQQKLGRDLKLEDFKEKGNIEIRFGYRLAQASIKPIDDLLLASALNAADAVTSSDEHPRYLNQTEQRRLARAYKYLLKVTGILAQR